MGRLLTVALLSVVVVLASGCARQDPRAARKEYLDNERSRSPAQSERLRERLSSIQHQR